MALRHHRGMSPRLRTPRPTLTAGRIYTRAELRALGLPASDLAHCGIVTRLFHNAYVATGSRIDLALRSRAALTVLPHGSVIDGPTAARLWGGTVPDLGEITASVPTRNSIRPAGITTISRTNLSDRARFTRHGVTVCHPLTAFTDCAGRLGLVELVVLGDSLVKARGLSPFDLVAAAQQMRGRHRRLAVEAANLVRAGVDSPPETRTRLLAVFAGLPEPTPNIIIRRADGSWDRRYDMGHEEEKVAYEYDGRQHAETTAQWRRDLRRREESDADGWRLVVVTSEDLYATPGETVERMCAALRSRGRYVSIRSDRWRRYFPGRD